MPFPLNLSGIKPKTPSTTTQTSAKTQSKPLSQLTGQTAADRLSTQQTPNERQIQDRSSTFQQPQQQYTPPSSLSSYANQYSGQPSGREQAPSAPVTPPASLSSYANQYPGQPSGREEAPTNPQAKTVSLDPSDRKFYLQSPDPGAVERFDEQYAAQLAAQQNGTQIQDDPVYQNQVEQVREVAQQGDPVATAQAVEQAAEEYPDQPEVVDQLIEDLQPEIEQAADGLSTEDYGREEALQTVTSLGRISDLASDDGAQAIAQTVVSVNELNTPSNSTELWYLDDAIEKVPQGGAITFGLALADELEIQGRDAAARDVRNDVVKNLDGLVDYVEESSEKRHELDETLTESMQNFRGLDEEALTEYIALYQNEHLDDYTAEADSAARLNEILGRHGDALDQLVVDTSSTGTYGNVGYPNADNIINAYETLAEGSLPAVATEWVLNEKPEDVNQAYARAGSDIEERILVPGLPGTLAQYQAEADGDPEAALERFESLFSDVKLGRSILSKTSDLTDIELDELRESGLQTAALLRDLSRPGGKERYLEALQERANDIGSLTALDTAFDVTGLTFAIINFGEEEGFVNNATDVLAITSGGLDILSKGINTLNKTGRLGFLTAENAALANRFSRFGARVVPGINVALNAVATAKSAGKFVDDPSAGQFLSVVGDGLSLVGAGIGVFGVTKPVAAVLEFGGLALSEVGTYWAEAGERNDINDEEERLLTQVFADRYPELKAEIGDENFAEAIRQLADASDPLPSDVFTRAGLDTEQLLRLFGTVPDSNNREGRRILDYAEQFDLTGDDFVEFVQAFDEQDAFGGYNALFFQAIQQLNLNPEQTLAILDQVGGDGIYDLSSQYNNHLTFTLNPHGETGLLASRFQDTGVDFDALGIDIEDYYEGDG